MWNMFQIEDAMLMFDKQTNRHRYVGTCILYILLRPMWIFHILYTFPHPLLLKIISEQQIADLQPLFTLYNLLLSANSLLNISLLWSKQKRGFWLNCICTLFLFQGFRFCDFWVWRNCGQSVRDSFSRDQQQNGEFNIFVSSSTLSANVY